MAKKTPPKPATKRRKPAAAVAPPATADSAAPNDFADLDALRAHHGESSFDECIVLLDTTREKLADSGRRFITTRATDDAPRIYGPATTFLLHGPADAVTKVKIDAVILRAGVWAVSQAGLAYAAKTAAVTAKRTQTKALASKSEESAAAARLVRDQLSSVMLNVAGNDHDLKARITTALTPAASGKTEVTPASVVASLVTIAREQLADTTAAVVTRRNAFKLTKEYVDDCAKGVSEGISVAKKADAPRTPAEIALSHADVEVWDGLALAFMEKVVDAFERAHAIDSRVPRLRFVSLASFVERGARKPAKAKKTPVTP